jgi:hypothetical protein
LVSITHDHHQTALNNKLLAQLNDYESKFKDVLN